MSGSYRKGYVYVRDSYAGTIEETDYGYSFKYNPDYLKQPDASCVSLTLPLKEEEYQSSVLFPFLMD